MFSCFLVILEPVFVRRQFVQKKVTGSFGLEIRAWITQSQSYVIHNCLMKNNRILKIILQLFDYFSAFEAANQSDSSTKRR